MGHPGNLPGAKAQVATSARPLAMISQTTGRQRCDGSRPSGKSSSKCGKSGMLPVNAFAQAANAALGIGSEPLMRA
jgi:hypothetical protein